MASAGSLPSSNGQPIDLLIATRFPTYFARHPRKVAWVIHQHRAAHELCGTPYSDFEHTEADVGLRRRPFELDARMLGECRRVFANSNNTARRLQTFNGVAAEGLYHPPPLADRLRTGPTGDYAVVVGRLERVKRVDLAIAALVHVPVRFGWSSLARATTRRDRTSRLGARSAGPRGLRRCRCRRRADQSLRRDRSPSSMLRSTRTTGT